MNSGWDEKRWRLFIFIILVSSIDFKLAPRRCLVRIDIGSHFWINWFCMLEFESWYRNIDIHFISKQLRIDEQRIEHLLNLPFSILCLIYILLLQSYKEDTFNGTFLKSSNSLTLCFITCLWLFHLLWCLRCPLTH